MYFSIGSTPQVGIHATSIAIINHAIHLGAFSTLDKAIDSGIAVKK
ncbi:hypothetical protein NARC_40083 [Candidatus Nitrosocosmicus arcticus]|uniref:Uncharacterized protein n=1 Tax=Candidatus Nitrosocosmicus arcticus TaxID=2035267 RepID=A0A557SX05_9ARCH|nr:hypothetical protein NARC_40083 [Candidatus Nitrosocosmicus arcticus]